MRRTPADLPSIALLASLALAPGLRADDPRGDLTPMATGPVHEAFLSPRRDVEPPRTPKSPPPPVVERPADEATDADARWIAGYWDWMPESGKFVWVTGAWRVPPPGRFWVNGFWNRDADGWRRTPGFWSDRASDRIAYHKDGPPTLRPADDPGPPPKPNCYYVPGQFVPEGDRLAWRKGFWADARPGWAWVPASWTRQPEGWTFQEGYWDRPLEDRGILYAPAELAGEIEDGRALTYRPYTEVSPELYGQLYGAFGRSSPWYDGYPGVCYDLGGRCFAYADYGRLAPYYGYLDYPALSAFGYPYYASPIGYAAPGPLAYGLGLPYFGFGNAILPLMTGYPLFGNLGLPGGGWGWGWPGWNPGSYAWGIPVWSGVALGTWPGFGWGTWGWSGPTIGAWPGFQNVGFPNWASGWGGWGWGWGGGGFGWGSPGFLWGCNPIFAGAYPYPTSGRRGPTTPPVDRPGGIVGDHRPFPGTMRQGPSMVKGLDVAPPPSSRPFAALEDRPHFAGMRSAAPDSPLRNVNDHPSTWMHAYNGVEPPMRRQHQAARPALTGDVVHVPGVGPMVREPSTAAGEGVGLGRMRQPTVDRVNGPGSPFYPQLGPGNFPSARGVETLFNPNAGRPSGMRQAEISQAQEAARQLTQPMPPRALGPAAPDLGALRQSPAFEGRMRGPTLGEGFTGGVRQPHGFVGTGNFGAGVYNGGSMFSGGMRNADAPGFGGIRGGLDSGGPAGGFGGFSGMHGGGGPGNLGGGAGAGFGGAGAVGGPGANFGGHMR